jgi:TetR/AcrR family transcriptional repressor of lmrAB and yxaGH operons
VDGKRITENGFWWSVRGLLSGIAGIQRICLYYYFPDGKEEISEAALRRTGQRVEANIREVMATAESAAAGVRALTTTIAERIEESGHRAGGHYDRRPRISAGWQSPQPRMPGRL